MRGATFRHVNRFHLVDISIHAPRAGSDRASRRLYRVRFHFNPRSPCGERLLFFCPLFDLIIISIHAPRAGSDDDCRIVQTTYKEFQSTLPVRGATPQQSKKALKDCNFNPRSPCGERRFAGSRGLRSPGYFNPRSPCGERPPRPCEDPHRWRISIHAPRAGSDRRKV